MTNIRPELTHREAQVALGVSKGQTCIEIGRGMKLSHESIRSLMKKLRSKTGLRRKPQLAVWATTNKDWLDELMKTLKAPKRRKPKVNGKARKL